MKALFQDGIIRIFSMIFLLVSIASFSVAAEPALERMNEEVFLQRKSGTMWQYDRSRRLRTPEDVERYLQTLNRGEFDDWRLPSRQELYELFAIYDLKEAGEVKIRLEGKYWLKNDSSGRYVGAWEIGDQCGPSRTFYTGKVGYVRAVRP